MAKEIETHDHDLGLQADLQRLLALPINRRRALTIGGVGGVALLSGCGSDSDNITTTNGSTSTGTSTTTTTTDSNGNTVISTDSCTVINEETEGPYPADGSNTYNNQTVNALALSGIVRSDIRTSIGTKNTAQGVPLKIILKLVNTNNSCSALSGYAIYLWHCTRDGTYSLYSANIASEDYLRGVQETDSNGQVTFTSIFPACYDGRWPHIHFEIYKSLAQATSYKNKIKTSQLAMPQSACNTVYATTGYSASASNLKKVSLSTDNVFGDDSAKYQLSSVTGSVSEGFTATLVVGIAV